jgi:tyrosine-protein phosphatase SIW14
VTRPGSPRRFCLWALIASAGPVWGMTVDTQCLPNFHQVDDHVYRGAQPSAEGWKELAKLGIHVVVDLRPDGELHEHWAGSERHAVEAAGMRYISVPMQGWAKPDSKEIARALAELKSGEGVFVHCRGGIDRTGTVIACYRMTHDHWTNERALEEARAEGMNPLQKAMQQYILDFRPAPPKPGDGIESAIITGRASGDSLPISGRLPLRR